MEYLLGNKKLFLDYLDKINSEDKTAIISHNDLDGIASAILINEILNRKGVCADSLNFIDYGKGNFEKSEKNFKKGTKSVFICDINAESDVEGLNYLENKYNVLVIDHHLSEVKCKNMIKTKSEDCTTFAIYEMGKDNFDLKKLEWLVCATMVSEKSFLNKSNFEFLKKRYPEITSDNIYNSEVGILSNKISSALIYFKNKENQVFDLILSNKINELDKYNLIIEKEIQKEIQKFRNNAEFYPEKNLYLYYSNPKFRLTSRVVSILSSKEVDKTFIYISDLNEGSGFSVASSRNQSGKVDLNSLMKKGVSGFENANAGGHIRASAAKFLKKDVERFKSNILSALSE